MANYYSDHPELEFHLSHPLMKRVVELKEKDMLTQSSSTMLLLTMRTLSRTTSRFLISLATLQPMLLNQTLRMLTLKVHTLRTSV